MTESLVSRWIRLRVTLCGLVLVVGFGIVVYRGYMLQVVEGTRLREMAEQQYLKEIDLPPRRGTIFDRHGAPLAASVDVDSVYVNPRAVQQRTAEVARQLAGILELDAWALQQKLSSRRYFTWVRRRISPRMARQVRALNLHGVGLTRESRRFYPNGGLGGSVVGFAGLDGRGLEGVELRLDGWLRGSPVRIAGLRDALGRSVLSEGARPVAAEGHDVQLSLDKLIQYETELALSEALFEVYADSGWLAAVVLDPATGDVLAMASAPSFDPNRYEEATPRQWRNRVVADAFEPGSTLKVFTVGGALQDGVITPEQEIECEKGYWRVGRYVIHDSHRYGKMPVAAILKKSSNIGAAKIAFLMGRKRLHHWLSRFRFGRQTEVLLPGERAGVLRPSGRWSDVGLANIAFGQGLTTTVLQIGQALTAVANDGVMMRPRLVQRVLNARGETVREFPPQGTRVLSAKVAADLRRLLVGVTEEGGTGTDAALVRYTVAGKTGTAQKVDPVTRTYSTDRWVSSFIGVVPASRPRLAIVVVVNEPAGEKHYGGEVAGPIFARIARKALTYLGVRPDREAAPPSRVAREVSAGRATEGYVTTEDDPAPPLPLPGGPQGSLNVPDFTGLSIAEVVSAARARGLKVQLRGSGRAVAQSPGPGPAPQQTVCLISFNPPT